MVQGLIGTQEILSHPITITRSFGLVFYLRCLVELLNHKKLTFLDLLRSSQGKNK